MVGVMSSAVPTIMTSTMIATISRVWLPSNGCSSATIWPEMSATVISQADTSAAATRNITTAVVCAAETNSAVQLRRASARGRRTVETNSAVDGGDDGRFGRREDAELQADDDDHRQHQRPEAVDQRAPASRRRLARGGGSMFSLRTTHHQVKHSATPSIRPGTMPAMNSLEIETLAATPKMTKPIDWAG